MNEYTKPTDNKKNKHQKRVCSRKKKHTGKQEERNYSASVIIINVAIRILRNKSERNKDKRLEQINEK